MALGKTVSELQATMPQPEFLAWIEFYKLYPFDDFHRFHRPAALVSASLGGGDIQQRLDWLQPDPATAELSDVDISLLKAFGATKAASADE